MMFRAVITFGVMKNKHYSVVESEVVQLIKQLVKAYLFRHYAAMRITLDAVSSNHRELQRLSAFGKL